MSQDERPQGDGDPRDGLEGTYTEIDGEPEPERTVHGQYTRTARGGPDSEDEGAYADAEHGGGTEPAPHSTHDRHGKYNRRDK